MSKFLTYVIRLPEDQEAWPAINTGMRALVEQHGGEITAASDEDEMTILDMIENHQDFPEYIADEARAQAKELCAQAVH
ncbi:hypothetical protein ABGT16_05305 [Pseudomonas asiatica]|uniref:hypothetical protein n=1 Tax=Pseudomonas asiatica TaxID=2219225 RepID=UPI00345CDF4D